MALVRTTHDHMGALRTMNSQIKVNFFVKEARKGPNF